MISHQIKNTNQEIEIMKKKNHMKILELQITITKGHNSRFQTAKEIASELEGKPTEIMQSEEPKEKALKKF